MLTGEMSSRPSAPLVRRPTIDELVVIAREAGKTNATRHTIHHWVADGHVDRPSRVGCDYRYPLQTVGQVDTLARWSIRSHGIATVRFALFIEASGITPEEALALTAERTGLLRTHIASARSEVRDPELLRREVEKAARLRGRNSVLPRQVRMPLQERVAAVAQLAGLILDAHVTGASPGTGTLERALGLRGGRSGADREVLVELAPKDGAALDPEAMHAAVLAATPARARVARNMVELFCLWFPAIIPGLLAVSKVSEAKFLAVIEEWAGKLTPERTSSSSPGSWPDRHPSPRTS
jgi:hypothetical protein